ncbi:muscarinic acetylcholine receptor M3-like [Diadema setosum]|uniref:muscarinic acetylcholine receptor M3-like n=1 Tax=Diadema setosum TaxID=31175 RepID=UPI003B3ADFDD
MAEMEANSAISLLNGTTTQITALRVVLVCILYIPVVIITIVGNVFVLVAYCRDERVRRNRTNTIILNLATADLIVGVIMAINAPSYILNEWLFGQNLCIFVWAFDFTCTDMSVIAVIAVSCDRFVMIQDTLRHRSQRSSKRIGLYFGLTWVACLSVHFCLAFVYHKHANGIDTVCCNLEYGKSKWLILILTIIEFVMPAFCILLLNSVVYFRLKRQQGQSFLSGRHQIPLRQSYLGTDAASGLYAEPGTVTLTSYMNASGHFFEADENATALMQVTCQGSPSCNRATSRTVTAPNPLRNNSRIMRVHRGGNTQVVEAKGDQV